MNRLSTQGRSKIVAALVEGVGIRATCRLTGFSKNTVTKLIEDLGPVLEAFQDEALAGLPCRVIECDEIWAPIFKKQKRVTEADAGKGYGDCWTFTAICADTKLIPTWLVGPRDANTAYRFLSDLSARMRHRVQVTTDGHSMYLEAMESAFGSNVDFAQLVKLYGVPPEAERRYSPAECIGTKQQAVSGRPDPKRISTSYVERANLSIRMGLRRFTRLTNGHSKKVENHCAALAIFFAHYNLCRPHQSLRNGQTPAMAAGVTDRRWSITDLIRLLEKVEAGEELLGESRHGRQSVT